MDQNMLEKENSLTSNESGASKFATLKIVGIEQNVWTSISLDFLSMTKANVRILSTKFMSENRMEVIVRRNIWPNSTNEQRTV